MGNSSRWVNRRVLVDGSVLDTSHSGEFKDHIGVLATRIGYLYR